MQSKNTILELVCAYQVLHLPEAESLNPIIRFLKLTTGEQLTDRKNFDGHLTASAFVLNKNHDSLLLLHHKKLGRWLTPGGHINASDANLQVAAKREAMEETGIRSADLSSFFKNGPSPVFDIDSHVIPTNINQNEVAHLHHDIRFLFVYNHEADLQLNEAEALDFKWVPVSDLVTDNTFGQVAKKIIQLLAKQKSYSLSHKPL